MGIKETIEAAKKKMEQIKKNHHFKKENDRRKQEAQLTKELMDCAGDLGVCLSNYERAIRRQSEEIREGMAKGYPITIQKNLLLDAAVGYLVVKEALFVIRSVATYDSIVDAYALLDMAAKTITGEKVKKPKKKKHPTREEYAFLNSIETMENKMKIVNSGGFMDMLIATGDIEKCMEAAREQGGVEPQQCEPAMPLEPQLEDSSPASSLSPEDMKYLKMMQTSNAWSDSQSFNAPNIPGGSNNPNTPPPAEAENKAGGEEE